MTRFVSLLLLLTICHPLATAREWDIQALGAVGDGATLNTAIIQEAINQAAAEGGGTIIVPTGRFLTGGLTLFSHITLFLESGAVLLGSPHLRDYPVHQPNYPSYNQAFQQHALLYAHEAREIQVLGPGTIDPQGGSSAFLPKTTQKPMRYQDRPFGIWLLRCQQVQLRDFHILGAAMWTIHLFECQQVRVSGLSIYAHANQNNDGIDIDGCRDVIVSNCIIDTGDDAICLKTTSLATCENVLVHQCLISSHCNALKIGTETLGNFRNIEFSHCLITPSTSDDVRHGHRSGDGGITLCMVDGGILEQVQVHHIRMEGPRVPICLRLGDRGRTVREGMPAPGPGRMRDIVIQDVSATGSDSLCSSVTGLSGQEVERVVLRNIQLNMPGGQKNFDRRQLVPAFQDKYPEGKMFGKLPASGGYFRHVNGLILDNIEINNQAPDERPGLWVEKVEELHTQQVSCPTCTHTIHHKVSDSFGEP